MIPQPLTPTALSHTIATLLATQKDTDDFPHVYHPGERHIERLGLVLEPAPELYAWVQKRQLDALFMHRPWRLHVDDLPEQLGVVSFHQPFDAALAVGYNRHLATALGLGDMRPLGEKDGLPLGMIGEVTPQAWETWEAQVRQQFRGIERSFAPRHGQVARVAIMGAMNDMLVRDAFQSGADVYITGQMRVPGREAVRETGIGVIAVGHARGEYWGLHQLAALLKEPYPTLHTFIWQGS